MLAEKVQPSVLTQILTGDKCGLKAWLLAPVSDCSPEVNNCLLHVAFDYCSHTHVLHSSGSTQYFCSTSLSTQKSTVLLMLSTCLNFLTHMEAHGFDG